MEKLTIKRIDPYRIRIEKTPPMRTTGLVYVNSALEKTLEHDMVLNQVANVACLPGIVGPSLAMPDIHWGYGFPIGGVAAFSLDEGVISPGGVGYDINCGVSCVLTSFTRDEVSSRINELLATLFGRIPSGVGSTNKDVRLSDKEFLKVLLKGASWATKSGYGSPGDLDAYEDRGSIAGANPDAVSKRALERGLPQLGTLGSGNHFLELDVVDFIADEERARKFGLFQGQIVILLHTGSRGLGHQICDDHVHEMLKAMPSHGIELPDRQLACAPVTSREGQAYLQAMAAAANFAFANRQIIIHLIRGSFEKTFGKSWDRLGMRLLYDCCHNIAKIEQISWKGSQRKVCVHRKGATRALPPGDVRLPERFTATGGPVLVPGDMGRMSFILAGSQWAEETFFSACHGAGRILSRRQAKKISRKRSIADELRRQEIHAVAASRSTLAEEIPEAYKDVSAVVNTITGAGIATAVARLRPVAMIKG
ncbi:MAG TPA: RtcB family protein [Deltaproteobacteria bacterium]|nr:RtcB family protein [Deltaproteobacteria bacterium]